MSYIDEKFPASFRGVPILVEGHTSSFGRKTAIYELPFDERGAATVDLGRRARKFKLKAWLLERLDLGLTLAQQRDRFVAALETRGPGLLVHPVYGRVMVVPVGEVNLLESTQSGGLIEIECEFIEHRGQVDPTPRPEPKGNTIAKARNLRAVAGETFAAGFLTTVPDFVALSNIATLDTALDDLHRLNQLVSAALAAPTTMARKIDAISDAAAQLINSPQLLYNAIEETHALLADAVNTLVKATGFSTSAGGPITMDGVVFKVAALGLESAEPTGTTPSHDDERANHARLLQTMRADALGAVAEVIAGMTFDSANDARNLMQTLVDALSNLAEEPIADVEVDPALFDAIRDLIAAVTARLTSVAGTLAELTTYTPPFTAPALVIAYQLYGDATRVDEVLARNPHIVHPAFVPGRVSLEVLSE